MSATDWDRLSQLFHEALELPEEQREAFLRRSCAGDESLLREISSMLAAHGGASSLKLEDRLLRDSSWDESADAMNGQMVGPYRLQSLIGRGGMGEVYLAERRDDQFERRVALKLIRPGFDGTELSDRFRQERQILARLEHPNIATLLDGGMHDDGRPYLVMQYVEGVTVTEYCTSNSLSIRQRLELFRTICHAVHFAHVNLIVHRDLKPENILVSAAGEVKLLDFGIAKLLDESADAATRSLVLTPEHAAPEQILGELVTTATDVYALGVLLYQLLTGKRPLSFPTSSATEMERIIREENPPPPSTRVQGGSKALRGELDNIVLMALRKEPQRRYQTALALSDDISRHLENQTVLAQPNSLAYMLRKFSIRHRAGIAIAVATMLALVGFVVTTTIQSRRVALERDRAQAEQAKSERIVDVLAGLLGQANPFQKPGSETLQVTDLIKEIEIAVEQMNDQPLVQARMWELLAEIHSARSNIGKVEEFQLRALEVYQASPGRELESARVLHAQAVLTMLTHGESKAEPLLRDSVERHRALLGERHPDFGSALQDLASATLLENPDRAMELLDEAMEIATATAQQRPIAVAAIYNRLGVYYLQRADFLAARESFSGALGILEINLPAEHPHILTVSHNIAACLSRLGQWEDALAMERSILASRERVLGASSLSVGNGWESIATNLANLGRWDEAEIAFESALSIYSETMGPEGGSVSNAYRNLGVLNFLRGEFDEAVALLDRALAIDEANGNAELRTSVLKRSQRAIALFGSGKRTKAIEAGQSALREVDRHALNPNDLYRARARVIQSTMLLTIGRVDSGAELLRGAIDIREQHPQTDLAELSRARCLLASAYASGPASRRDEARTLFAANYPRIADWGLIDPIQRRILEDAATKLGLSPDEF